MHRGSVTFQECRIALGIKLPGATIRHWCPALHASPFKGFEAGQQFAQYHLDVEAELAIVIEPAVVSIVFVELDSLAVERLVLRGVLSRDAVNIGILLRTGNVTRDAGIEAGPINFRPH